MKTWLSVLCAALLAMSCRSVPDPHPAVQSARATFASVNATSDLSAEARYELRRAEQALLAAEEAHGRQEDPGLVRHLAYVAEQRALLAKEREQFKRADQRVAEASAAHSSALLESRDRALDAERRAAERADEADRRATEQVAVAERRASERAAAAAKQAAQDSWHAAVAAQRQTIVESVRRSALAERQERQRLAPRSSPSETNKPAAAAAAKPAAPSGQKAKPARGKARATDTQEPKVAVEQAQGQAPPAAAQGKTAAAAATLPTAEPPDRAEAARKAEVANNAEAAGTQPAAEKPSASDAAAASKQQLAAATPRASGDHTPRRPSAPEASNKQASDLQQVSPHGSVVTLTDDLFHAGAPYLRPGATRSIDPLAEFLRANPKRKLRIAGFAQSPEQALSKGRADEVREALMRRGVAADRIQAVGLAKSDARQTPYVEIVISDERGNITAR